MSDSNAPVAVVTGGSSGLGKAFVASLCARGYVVVACGRDLAKLRRLADEFPAVETHALDVCDAEAMRAFARETLAAHPKIDLLVSNAGGLSEIDFTRDGVETTDLTRDIRVNLDGAIHFVASFLPALIRARSGAILIVSSGYALAPATRAPIYSAAKAGLHSFAKSLRRQLAPLNVTVTEVLPPVVDTPSVAHRKVAKLPADAVAEQALNGALKGAAEVLPGQTRFLPFLLRLAPTLAERIVAES
jgi:uncharacterized oxidoreductase